MVTSVCVLFINVKWQSAFRSFLCQPTLSFEKSPACISFDSVFISFRSLAFTCTHTCCEWGSPITSMLALSSSPCFDHLKSDHVLHSQIPPLHYGCLGPTFSLDEAWLNLRHWLVTTTVTEESKAEQKEQSARRAGLEYICLFGSNQFCNVSLHLLCCQSFPWTSRHILLKLTERNYYNWCN